MNVSFKGYDACPIRKLYTIAGKQSLPGDRHAAMLHDELTQIGEKEGFEAHLQKFDGFRARWAQDYFIPRPNNTIVHGEDPFESFYRQFGFKEQRDNNMPQGGNIFIGKKPDGETFILVGEDSVTLNASKKITEERFLAQDFDVKAENIHLMPQINFHLDTFMRPIGYPYVLINDPKLAVQNLKELLSDKELKDDDIKQVQEYIKGTKQLEEGLEERYEHNVDDLIERLEDCGFAPIKIGGVYGGDRLFRIGRVNFMNAIVNKHKDGTLSYITNSSPRLNRVDEKLEKLFEKQLREVVSKEAGGELDRVYFVQGQPPNSPLEMNSISEGITHLGGGVHCLCAEEPNFDTWV